MPPVGSVKRNNTTNKYKKDIQNPIKNKNEWLPIVNIDISNVGSFKFIIKFKVTPHIKPKWLIMIYIKE